MKKLLYIIPLVLLCFSSCRDFHVTLAGDAVMVEVDGKHLMHSDIAAVLPNGYRGDDSVAFVKVFIDKWIRKQVKLREAEEVFANAESDIDAMVEQYRQLMLIKRLEERCISSLIDTTFTQDQISDYYDRNRNNFRLNSQIVKGEVLRVPLNHDQTKKIKGLMSSTSESKRNDFAAICEKNGFDYVDYSSAWVESTAILDELPLTRGAESDKLLSKSGVNHMNDGNYDYYYQIFDYKKSGEVAPLEWVRSTIQTILITERQQTLLRDNEEMLYNRAQEENVIKLRY